MRHKRFKFAVAALTVSVVLAVAVGLSDVGQAATLSLVGGLESLIERFYWPGVIIYIFAFAVLITLTLPMATVFTVTGGFLFGAGIGSAAALSAMTLGAILTFGLMRMLKVREDSRFLRHGRARAVFELLDRNAFFYVALFRIVPVAPCFAINAGAAFTRLDPARFLIASLVGLAPSSVVYASLGSGLDSLISAPEVMNPAILVEPRIALPLLGMVVLIGVSWLLRNRLPGLDPEA